MSHSSKRVVNLIMPVYRGGVHWDLTLDSLHQARHLFGQVIMSFDGPTRIDLAQSMASGNKSKLADVVLVTPVAMDATEHILWIGDQFPLTSWSDDQLVMLMAEDDLICERALSSALAAVIENENSILFGAWSNYESSSEPVEMQELSPNLLPKIYPEEQIASQLIYWVNHGEVTTISGITIEMRAFRSYLKQVAGVNRNFPLLTGVRTEFFLATQPSVKALVRSFSPITLIQNHSQQEGFILPISQKNQDEALYQLWLTVTRQKTSPGARFVAVLRLAKRVIRDPKIFKSLPNALLTFRKVNNDL